MTELTHPGIPTYVDLGSPPPGVSVVIPVYERSGKLARTLWSLHHTADLPYELIVSEARQSVARNRNKGLKRASQDLVVMIDDDVLLPPFWMSKMAFILRNESIGVISAKMTNPDGTPQNALADIMPGQVKICVPPGTCFMYSRSRVEGCTFDEEYRASQWEDTDFMMQVRSMGLNTAATGDVWILHDNNFSGVDMEVWNFNKEHFKKRWPGVVREPESP